MTVPNSDHPLIRFPIDVCRRLYPGDEPTHEYTRGPVSLYLLKKAGIVAIFEKDRFVGWNLADHTHADLVNTPYGCFTVTAATFPEALAKIAWLKPKAA